MRSAGSASLVRPTTGTDYHVRSGEWYDRKCWTGTLLDAYKLSASPNGTDLKEQQRKLFF
jgi:hypothetical protein